MVIYEVNLTINSDIYSQFQLWLRNHITEMLQFPGFIKASILKQEQKNKPEQEELTVQYQLENRTALETYFIQFAPRMREEGIKLFNNKFSAERRIFEVVQENILK
jgi:hypothetical protein